MKTILFTIAAAGFFHLVIETKAQSFSMDWFTIGNAGGTISGAGYTLSASVGKSDSIATMNGESFALAGGFWAITTVSTQDEPTLSILLTATNTAVMLWPSPSTGFVLQQSSELPSSTWIPVVGTVADDGTNRSIVIHPPPVGNRFYRLVRP